MNNPVNNRITAKKFLLINWSRFQHVTFEMAGSTLLTGVNGTGKSTILDAMSYLISGNTKFNQAARDKDRGVKAYVRGDTQSNGDYRYLRKGDVTSYIAMEFYNPTENKSLVVAVNIEYIDASDSIQSRWFILPETKLQDISWAEINEETGKFKVIPRSLLLVKDMRIKGNLFLNRNTGIPAVLRALGIRTDVRRYQTKLAKMMAFNPENNINRFIQESVLEEDPVNSLGEIREYREQFNRIKEQYDDMLAQKRKLEELETKTQTYEKQAYKLRLYELMLDYQKVRQIEIKRTELIHNIRSEKMRLLSLEKHSETIHRQLEQATQRYADARNSSIMQNVEGAISSLENQLKILQVDYDNSNQANAAVKKIQKEIRSTLEWLPQNKNLTTAERNVLRELGTTAYAPEEKISAFEKYAETAQITKETLARDSTHLRDQLKEQYQIRDDLYHQKALLDSNQMIYDQNAEKAKCIIETELEKKGIKTEIFLFAELVKDIVDPDWRQAIETFLGYKRFYIIAEENYVTDVLQIIDQKNLYNIHAVITDKLPKELDEVKSGSAAEQLIISNKSARRYANYLLNGIHLCKDLDELHEYPLGGLMKNGMLAKSYSASKMNIQKTRICLGKDAIDIQKRETRQNIAKTIKEIEKIQSELAPVEQHWHQLEGMNLSSDYYDFEAASTLNSLNRKMAELKTSIQQIKTNPEFQAALQEQEDARKAYDQSMLENNEQIRKVSACNASIDAYSAQRDDIEIELQQNKKAYQDHLATMPEMESPVKEEYERITARNKSAIAIQETTVSRQRTELNNVIIPSMTALQNEYLRLLGRMNEFGTMTGPSRIPFYREEYLKLKNIRIDEVRQQLKEKSEQLESAFMHDFVAELNEKIQREYDEIDGINRELRETPFGLDTYRFEMKPRSDRSTFFHIAARLNEYMDSPEWMLAGESGNQQMEHDIQEFMSLILNENDDDQYTDYRTYFNYDMKIISHQGDENIESELSRKQGSASGGEKQTPYFIILAASLMQCYPRDLCCERLAFIDEAFSALSRERIEQMVKYLEDNHFQVIYAAPPEKIASIGSHIDTTVSLVTKGRYSFAIEGSKL